MPAKGTLKQFTDKDAGTTRLRAHGGGARRIAAPADVPAGDTLIGVHVPPEYARRLKIYAATHGTTVSALARQWIRQLLAEAEASEERSPADEQ